MCLSNGHSAIDIHFERTNADINAALNIKSKGVALFREREPIGCALGLEPHGI